MNPIWNIFREDARQCVVSCDSEIYLLNFLEEIKDLDLNINKTKSESSNSAGEMNKETNPFIGITSSVMTSSTAEYFSHKTCLKLVLKIIASQINKQVL